jgi:pimeloyl-ACP methyl ester carboxylesterase
VTTLDGGTVVVRHHRIDLALHRLRSPADGDGVGPLLCLHGLGSRAAELPGAPLEAWPGPVWGLDFTGHGASTVPTGGGYSPELLVGDADHALGHLGPATVAGFGLGAYVGLLLAGARPTAVRGLLLADGPGIDGGRLEPRALALVPAPGPSALAQPTGDGRPDPFALAELAADVRPPAYALGYARAAIAGGARPAIVVAAAARPPWLEAVVAEPGVADAGGEDGRVADGLRRLSAAIG